jgi:hypothetical protein
MERRTRAWIELLRPDRERIRRVAFVDAFIDAMKLNDELTLSWLCEHEFETVRARWRLWTNEGRSDDWIEQYVSAFRGIPRCSLGCHDAEEVFPDA